MYDLWDTYLPAFEAGFVRGNASGAMCSYISLAIGGTSISAAVPSCANPYLLQTVVREYWGRSDAVHTSDCGAVSNMATSNHYVTNLTYAAAVALSAGMDLNSESTLPKNLPLAISLGLVSVAALDAAISRTLTARMRVGMLDPISLLGAYGRYDWSNVSMPASRDAAAEGVLQGTVLIKNDGGTLPLRRGISLAVVGPTCDNTDAMLGDFYADIAGV